MSFDAVQDALEQTSSAAPDPIDEVFRRRDAQQTIDMRRGTVAADPVSPDDQAEALALSKRLGLPADVVRRNLPEMRKRAKVVETDYGAMLRDTPAVADTLAREPDHAPVIQDDLAPLGFLEWLVRAPQRALAQGQAQVTYGLLRSKSLTGSLSADEQTQMAAAQQAMTVGGALGAEHSWFRGAITGAARQLPMLWGGAVEGVKYGAPGAVAGGTMAAIAGLLGPQAALPEELLSVPGMAAAGGRAGFIAGSAKFAFELQTGLAYDEYAKFTDELGQPIAPSIAKAAALATGALTAGLQSFGLERIIETIPGVRQLGTAGVAGAVQTALKNPTIRTALGNLIKSYGGELTAQTALQVAQRAATILSGEIAKAAANRTGRVQLGSLGARADGSPKGEGYFGLLRRPDGDFSSELSIGVTLDGHDVEIPAMVPTLTEPEVAQLLLADPSAPMSPAIVEKAVAFAKQRAAAGQPFFAGQGETTNQYPDLARAKPAFAHASGGEIAGDLVASAADAIQSFALVLAPTHAAAFLGDVGRAQRAQHNAQFFQALAEGAQQSKTVTRAPDVAEQILAKATAGSPLEHVYAPIDTWTQYWQAQHVDPRAMATELTGDPDAFDQAARTGERLAIPTAKYAVTLAGTKHNAFFAHELSTGPNEMNGREAAAFVEAVKRRPPAPTVSPTAQIRASVVQQLEGAGVERSTAESYATLYESAFGTMAERAGLDPVELYRRYGLMVRREGSTASRAAELAVDPEAVLSGADNGATLPGDGEGAGGETAAGTDLRGRAPQSVAAPSERSPAGGGERAGAEPRGPVTLPAAAGPHFDELLADARARGFNGSDDSLKQLYAARYGEAQSIARDLAEFDAADANGWREILQAVAAAGGIGIEAEGQAGMRGEIETLLEGLNKSHGVIKRGVNAGRKMSRAMMRSGGIEGITGIIKRKGGQPIDTIRESLNEDPRWRGRFDNLSDFVAEVEDAVGIANGTREAPGGARHDVEQVLEGALGVKPGVDWWTPPARETFAVYDADGNRRAIVGPDAAEYQPHEGESLVAETPAGVHVLVDRGGRVPTEFGQDAAPKVDALSTGELQPRLPGDVGDVRDTEIAQPTLGDVKDEFTLTAPQETQPTQTTLFQSAPPIGTPAFRRWFGASMMVDSEGRPVVAYHGTAEDFDAFDLSKAGAGSGAPDQHALFFTVRPDVASHYASTSGVGRAEREGRGVTVPIDAQTSFEHLGDQVLPVFLKIERPLISPIDHYNSRAMADEIARAKAAGHDGILFPKIRGAAEEGQVAVFSPAQVKSAIGNRGTFDPADRSILLQDRRGYIRFGADRQMNVGLLERADLSTFLHETGHLFFEVFADVADAIQATDVETLTGDQRQLLSDYGQLLEQLGVQRREDVGTDQHEILAKGFERYLLEGKAPSLALRDVFARYRAWLLGVYRSLTNLGARLTPEVRGVFDRMLATDRAIGEAEAEGKFAPLFLTPETAGMTPDQFELYREHVTRASQAAQEQLETRVMASVERERRASWAAARETTEATVRGELAQRPEYRALAAIQKGTAPDGAPLVEGAEPEPMKLSRQAIVDRFGADRLKRLPKPYVYTREGGLDPEVVAPMFGYSSGDELLTALERAEPFARAIVAETERRMIAQHGDVLLDGTLHDRAREAAANDTRDQVVRAEAHALAGLQRVAQPFIDAARSDEQKSGDYERRWFDAEAKLRIAIAEGHKQVEIDALRAEVADLRSKARRGPAAIRAALPSAAAVKIAAETRIARTKVRDLTPPVFWSAAVRASREALDAAARQDFGKATEAKVQQLLNLALYREAMATKDEIDTRVAKIRELTKPKARERLGKAGESYLDQVDGILDRYSFTRVSQQALDRRTSLAKWIAEREGEGLPVDLPAELVEETKRVPYQELTIESLRGVSDGLAQIVHLSRLKNRLLKAAGDRDLAAAVGAMVGSMDEHGGSRKQPALEVRLPAERTARAAAWWFAAHRKLASFLRQLDGWQDGGAMWEHVMRPLNEASAHEATMKAEATEKLAALFHDAFAGEEHTLYTKTYLPAIDNSLSKMGRLAVALNWGNQGNRDRLLSDRLRRWNGDQVQAILGTLDARDWRFVQGVWDLIGSYWPQIEAKQKRVFGVAPERVEATPVETPFGTFKGGYFPIAYEGWLSAKSASSLDADFGDSIQKAAYVQASTRRGHTEARQKSVTEPLRLDFGVITDHLTQVIHDLTHHETLIDAGRLLGNRQVQDAIYAHTSDVVYQQMKGVLRDIAWGAAPAPEWYRPLNALRQRVVSAGLGMNVLTAAMQPLQVTNAMIRVGPQWVARGFIRWARTARTMEGTTAWIQDRSEFMRNRARTQMREINEVRNQVGLDRGRVASWMHDALYAIGVRPDRMPAVADSYYYLIQKGQQLADIPTWLGAYEKAMHGDETEDRAVALADQAVIDSQASGDIKDLAAVERQPLLKILTTFYSYNNLLYNQAVEITKRTDFKSPRAIGRLGVDAMMLLFVPSAMTYFLRQAFVGATGSDDDTWKALAKHELSDLFGMMVGARELSGVIEGRDYEGPAGMRYVSTIAKAGTQVSQGELDPAFWRSLNQSAGVLFNYPSTQVQRTAEGLAALMDGRTQNPLAVFTGPDEAAR